MARNLNITFGVELEFLLSYFAEALPQRITDGIKQGRVSEKEIRDLRRQEEDAQRAKLVLVLRSAGLAVNDYRTPDYQKWTVEGDGSVKPERSMLETMNPQWANGTRTALTPEMRAALRYVDVEIVSPVLTYGTAAFLEVGTAIKAIVSRFPVHVNETTGLHVHVGNQSFGFPLSALKNVATLVSCFEDQFNQIHPAHRLTNDYCALPRWAFEPDERSPQKIAEIIAGIDSVARFEWRFCTERSSRGVHNNWRAYNFGNAMAKTGKKKTIEFRQHKGSLDAQEVQRWIILTCNVVKIAHEANEGAISQALTRYSNRTNFTILDLLRVFGLQDIAMLYEGHVYHHNPNMKLKDAFPNEDND
ncbi:MAG: hypothetical protein Q9187_002532 [Circinaria calcarea]